jgi:hypothetical protein
LPAQARGLVSCIWFATHAPGQARPCDAGQDGLERTHTKEWLNAQTF